MYTVVAFNGVVWTSGSMVDNIYSAILHFKKETGLHEMDIKKIINNH